VVAWVPVNVVDLNLLPVRSTDAAGVVVVEEKLGFKFRVLFPGHCCHPVAHSACAHDTTMAEADVPIVSATPADAYT
jgi:hypothetical protein